MVLKRQSRVYGKSRTVGRKTRLSDLLAQYPFQLSGAAATVAIARAMAMNPKVLAYDEPTSALDPGLRQQVEQLILDLKKKE